MSDFAEIVRTMATGLARRGGIKPFGYIAVFPDNDAKCHSTNFPKTHCLRKTINGYRRWQYIYGEPGGTREGWVDFPGGHRWYTFHRSLAEAMYYADKAIRSTVGRGYPHFERYAINGFLDQWPEYSEVAVVELTEVFADGPMPINDPRFVFCERPMGLQPALEEARTG